MPKSKLIFACPRHAAFIAVHPGWGHCKRCLREKGWTDDDLSLTPFQKMIVMELADGGHLERYEAYGGYYFQTLIPNPKTGYWAIHFPQYDKVGRAITIPRHVFHSISTAGWVEDAGPRSEHDEKTHRWELTDKAERFIKMAEQAAASGGWLREESNDGQGSDPKQADVVRDMGR